MSTCHHRGESNCSETELDSVIDCHAINGTEKEEVFKQITRVLRRLLQ